MSEQQQEPEDDGATWDGIAQAFADAEDNEEEDSAPFSVLSDGLLGGSTEKIPLEQSPNLLLAREAAEQIRNDEIDPEEYLEKIMQVAQVAENGIKLFSAEVVKKETEKLPPEQQQMVREFEEQVYVLKEGTDLMAAYVDSGNIDDLDRGLQLVEQSMAAVDKIQDRAIDLMRLEQEQAAQAAETEETESGTEA